MEQDDRELFERSLRHATEEHTGAALDASLAEPFATAGAYRAAVDDIRSAATAYYSGPDLAMDDATYDRWLSFDRYGIAVVLALVLVFNRQFQAILASGTDTVLNVFQTVLG